MEIKFRRDAGFTLIEILVAVVISFIILLVLYNILNNFYRMYHKKQQILQVQEDAAYAIDIISNGFWQEVSGAKRRVSGIRGVSRIRTPNNNTGLSLHEKVTDIYIAGYFVQPHNGGYALVCTDSNYKIYYIIPKNEFSQESLDKYTDIKTHFDVGPVHDVQDKRLKVRVTLELAKEIYGEEYRYTLEEDVIAMVK
ncbi:MAG: prepilin-type N-terminal cleavage/methylation domain-containing protein [bacterium]